MCPSFRVIERVQTSRGELQLQQRGDHYELISNGVFLMATYNGESEKLLVRAALDNISHPQRIAIGGLGIGFSLAEALRQPSIREVKVIEIEEKMVEWNRDYLSAFSSHAATDARTQIVLDDFLEWMWWDEGRYDAICLDIDNGPDWTVTDANNALYREDSLVRLGRMLRPRGVVAFWSASHSSDFQERLQQIYGHVRCIKFPSERGEDDCIYIASP